ncbi:MAG: DUF1800 domain-containing protein [Bacteroidota bacterium]
METKAIQHLYSRVGFGILPNDIPSLSGLKKEDVVAQLFSKSREADPLKIDLAELDDFIDNDSRQKLSRAIRQELRKKSRQKIKDYNSAWISRLVTTDQQLREKMVLFWANVFVCRDNHIFHVQQYNNTLRKHALGHLGDFLKAVAKEPAMSKYLNNRQNVKEKPNENFARELMELFTLGEGHYSEYDIKEAARAFTGWSFRPNGEFFLRQKKHDTGVKVFLGKSGNFDGNAIIDIILQQKQCARFICEKVYRYFVNPRVNQQHLNEMVAVFYPKYNIEKLMEHILLSDWFYEDENIGAKIKSPMELLVGIQRIVPLTFAKEKQLLYLQRTMGQVLLYPPNVAGWKQDRNWIDSNTLLFRMKLPSVLLNDTVINVDQKGDFEDSFEKYYADSRKRARKLDVEKDWTIFDLEFLALNRDEIRESLIRGKIDGDTLIFLDTLTNLDPKEYLVQLMSIPEYQLC